jgi:hypothetical protein
MSNKFESNNYFKIIAVLTIILVLSGCGKTNSNSIDHQSNTINASNKQEKLITPASDNEAVSETKDSEKVDMKKYIDSNSKLELEGKVGSNMGIHMELEAVSTGLTPLDGWWNQSALSLTDNIKQYKGTYYYDKYKKNITIEVRIYTKNNYISIAEFDEKNNANGFFSGFISTNAITGMWLDKTGKPAYSFYLIKEGQQSDVANNNVKSNIIGQYLRANTNGDIVSIQAETDTVFKFNIDGSWHDHIGHVDGVATYTDSTKTKAIYKNTKDNLNMTFTFKNNVVEVNANEAIQNYGGANVSLIGTYQKK